MMRRFKDASIRTKLIMLLGATSGVAVVLACVAFVINDVRMIKSSMVQHLTALTDVLGANSTAALSFSDSEVAEEVLDSLRIERDVAFAGIYDVEGKLFASYPAGQHGVQTIDGRLVGTEFMESGYLESFQRIEHDGETVGFILLRASMDRLDKQLTSYVVIVMVVVLMAMLVSIMLASRLQRLISSPILVLAKATQEIGEQQDYTVRVQKDSSDELGVLCDSFNEMLSRIEERDFELKKYRDHLEDIVDERTSELQETNRRLREAIEHANQMAVRAKAANVAKSEFLANMSHEIRTPLNGVVGMTSLLLNTGLSDEQHGYVKTILSSGDALLTVISDVLDYSKIEAGKLDFEMLDFDLVQLVDEIAVLLAMRAHQKGLEINCLVHPEVPTLLKGDSGRLRQVLINLLGNAIKFTSQGEVFIEVSLDMSTDVNARVRFTVNDTGIGIPADRLESIFESFSQVDASTTRRYGGTGLGLAISKQLVDLMGGKIGVSSELGSGSEFWFQLDLGRRDGEDVKTLELVASGVRVLVIDDSQTALRALSTHLGALGFQVEIASSGAQGLTWIREAAAETKPFQLVLIDCLIPGEDAEASRKAMREYLPPDAKIVALVPLGQAHQGDTQSFTDFDGILKKPVASNKLLACLAGFSSLGPATGKPREMPDEDQVVELGGRYVLRVLVVEDNAVNQMVARKLIERLGHTVTVVDNGRQAIELLSRQSIDLVFMDVQMPVMDGFEATKIIRDPGSLVLNHDLPIIAMTAHAMKGDRERCIEAGMNDYVSKPTSSLDIEKVVARQLHKVVKLETRAVSSKTSEVDQVFDRHGVLERLGGNLEFLKEMADMFMETAPNLVQKIGIAVDEGNAESLWEQAHTLRGACATIGARSLHALALQIETAAKDRQLGDLRAKFERLGQEFDKLNHELAGLA